MKSFRKRLVTSFGPYWVQFDLVRSSRADKPPRRGNPLPYISLPLWPIQVAGVSGGPRCGEPAGSGIRGVVFDPSGAARVTYVTPDEEERRYHFWINEQSPTFLHADPPGRPGEPRFEVEFGIDGNKRLLITARDLKTKRVTYRDHPVVKLT